MISWTKSPLTDKSGFALRWILDSTTDSGRARAQTPTPRFITSPRPGSLSGFPSVPLFTAPLPSQALIHPLKYPAHPLSSPLPYVFPSSCGPSRSTYLLNKPHCTYSVGCEMGFRLCLRSQGQLHGHPPGEQWQIIPQRHTQFKYKVVLSKAEVLFLHKSNCNFLLRHSSPPKWTSTAFCLPNSGKTHFQTLLFMQISWEAAFHPGEICNKDSSHRIQSTSPTAPRKTEMS